MAFEHITVSAQLVGETCITCGIEFGVPADWKKEKRRNHTCFYCPNGHEMFYPGETETEKLKVELAASRAEVSRVSAEKGTAERRAERLKREMARKDKRIASGVCPCCNRYFENVHKHMTTQHPEQGGAKHAAPKRKRK